jgi:hypothetical protein
VLAAQVNDPYSVVFIGHPFQIRLDLRFVLWTNHDR